MNSPTLLSFLEAPVLVGDPDGRVAYVNPAFEGVFASAAQTVVGQPLANLFEGGVREAILRAVAEVCQRGSSIRFRVRHSGVGYAGLASPIVAEDARVGFVILLLANASEDERIHALARRVQEPVDELGRLLDELGEQTGVSGADRARELVDEGLRAVGRVRRLGAELGSLLDGKPGPMADTVFDPARVINDVASLVSDEFAAARVDFQVHVPARLPRVRGDQGRLHDAIVELLRERLGGCGKTSSVSVRARSIDRGGESSVVVAVLDSHGDEGPRIPGEAVPEGVRRVIQQLGAEVRTSSDPIAGRTTAIRLTALKQ